MRTFVDTTQAMGWLPLDCAPFDYTACAAYKWLLSPRGTAFFTIRPERRDDLIPHAAGWYAGEDVPSSYYGAPLRLAADARRFDLSPAWLNWVGAAAVARAARGRRDRRDPRARRGAGRAARRRASGCRRPGTAFVSVGGLPDDAAERLRDAGVMAAGRGGALRLSCHLYTTAAHVDRALEVLAA